MKSKYNLLQVVKLLERMFEAGYVDEKSILAIQLDDLEKISDITSTEITIIIDLKKAIRNKKIIAFLNCNKEKKEEGKKNV